MDLNWLREAYGRTRKDGATGVDGGTASAYAEDLEGNLSALLTRLKAGTYRAPQYDESIFRKGTRSWVPNSRATSATTA